LSVASREWSTDALRKLISSGKRLGRKISAKPMRRSIATSNRRAAERLSNHITRSGRSGSTEFIHSPVFFDCVRNWPVIDQPARMQYQPALAQCRQRAKVVRCEHKYLRLLDEFGNPPFRLVHEGSIPRADDLVEQQDV